MLRAVPLHLLLAIIAGGCWLVSMPAPTSRILTYALTEPPGAPVLTATLDERSGWLRGARPASAAESDLATPVDGARITLVTHPDAQEALVLGWRDEACSRSALVSISEGVRAIDVQVFPERCPAGTVVRALTLLFDRVIDPGAVAVSVYTD